MNLNKVSIVLLKFFHVGKSFIENHTLMNISKLSHPSRAFRSSFIRIKRNKFINDNKNRFRREISAPEFIAVFSFNNITKCELMVSDIRNHNSNYQTTATYEIRVQTNRINVHYSSEYKIPEDSKSKWVKVMMKKCIKQTTE